jgi:hypothetical protein
MSFQIAAKFLALSISTVLKFVIAQSPEDHHLHGISGGVVDSNQWMCRVGVVSASEVGGLESDRATTMTQPAQ